jgi:hypothetical protein
MLESSDDLMSIVVLEAGAAWPAWLAEYQRLAPNAVVVAQARTEEAELFGHRVVHRIAEATHSSGARVRVGVIVAGDSGDEGRLSLRENVARAILKKMVPGREAELVLAGDGHELDRSRQDLFELAGALCEELGGTGVNVRVRFSHAKSGVMRTVPASVADPEILSSKSSG